MTPSTPLPSAARVPIGLLIAGGVALVLLFTPTFDQLFRVYMLDSNYQHGFLVLPLAIALAWHAAQQNPLPETAIGKASELLGICLILLGFAAQLLGVLSRFLPIEFLAMAMILSGAVILVGGVTWARHFAFPIFFLIFMFPLPAALTSTIAVQLQNDVAALSNEALGWLFLCYRRGNNIHIAGVDEPMFVAQECSGIRQVMAFVALAALISYWFGFRLHLLRVILGGLALGLAMNVVRRFSSLVIPWEVMLVLMAVIAFCLRVHWLVLVSLAVPVAIFANIVRVVLMGVGLVYFGPSWFTTKLHDLPALFTLPLGVVCFFGLVWLIAPSPPTDPPPPAPPSPDALLNKTELEGQPT